MTTQRYYDAGHHACRHHRYKFLRVTSTGNYLFHCIRPSCDTKVAMFRSDFWKKAS